MPWIILYFSDPFRLIVGFLVFCCVAEVLADAIRRARK